MSLQLRPLHPDFGAEAGGLDLTQPLDAGQVAEVLLREHPGAAQRHVGRWLGHKSEYLKA